MDLIPGAPSQAQTGLGSFLTGLAGGVANRAQEDRQNQQRMDAASAQMEALRGMKNAELQSSETREMIQPDEFNSLAQASGLPHRIDNAVPKELAYHLLDSYSRERQAQTRARTAGRTAPAFNARLVEDSALKAARATLGKQYAAVPYESLPPDQVPLFNQAYRNAKQTAINAYENQYKAKLNIPVGDYLKSGSKSKWFGLSSAPDVSVLPQGGGAGNGGAPGAAAEPGWVAQIPDPALQNRIRLNAAKGHDWGDLRNTTEVINALGN